jgi:hypothetical protein
VHKEDYINPTANGMLSWRSIISCASDSDTGVEKWQQRLHELSTRRCARMTCVLRWIGSEVRETPTFYGLNDLKECFVKFELEVVQSQRLPVLDYALKYTPAHWWGTHKENINNWFQCKRLLRIRFDAQQEHKYQEKCDGIGQPKEHIDRCMIQWILVPPEEWPHHFIHTLEGIPKNLYIEQEQRRETKNWEEIQQNFVVTFSFEHEIPEINTTLKVVRDRLFEEPEFEIISTYQKQNRHTMKLLLHCYHVAEEEELAEDNPRNI